jgi:hypothetical protein
MASQNDVDIEYLEDTEWDFTTYLKILDHKKVDYAQDEHNFSSKESDKQFADDPWNVSVSGRPTMFPITC